MSDIDEEIACLPDAPVYCEVCMLPPEYCEFGSTVKQCRAWLEQNDPDLLEEITQGLDEAKLDGADGKKSIGGGSKRGGKALKKPKSAKIVEPSQGKLIIKRQQRNKRKFVTTIDGLESCGVNLKKASKFFGAKFACGASVQKDGSIAIQGDFVDDIPDLVIQQYLLNSSQIEIKL